LSNKYLYSTQYDESDVSTLRISVADQPVVFKHF
jgi:hypothetical protein